MKAAVRSKCIGALTILPVWLAALSGCVRQRPTTPDPPRGPRGGSVGVRHVFQTSSVDWQGDPVECRFDWGDGQVSDWAPIDSIWGQFTGIHTWTAPGTYGVRAQARDGSGNATPWSPRLSDPWRPPGVMVGDTAGGYGYGRVRAVIQLGTAPGSLALSKDGQVLYVVLPDGNSVAAIRTSDYRVATEIPVGADPAAIAVSPDSAFVYVANWMDQDVSVISTADNTVQRRIQVGFCPSALAVCAGGTRLFVGGLDTEYAEVIALPEDTVVAWVEVPAGVRKMATDISEWGVFDWVLVATNGFDVLRLDGTSGQVMKAYHLDGYVATVDAGQYSSNIGWWAAGQSLDGEPFLASLGSSNVFFTMRRGCFSDMDERCVLDALNRWLVLFYDDYPQEPGGSPGTIVPLGTSPEHVVVAGRQAYNAGYIYVTDPVDRTLTVIR